MFSAICYTRILYFSKSLSEAFKPTGSTTSALVELLHLVHTMFDQGNDYVRCILIDFSKAFDVVNHEILLKELSTLGMNSSIYNWIADFLTGRSQAVKLGDIVSAFLMITRSIVQGSGLGPCLFILLARKLWALSLINRLVKYADDMTLVVPQHTDCLIDEELKNIVNWAENNKQNINTNKTKEIIFWKTGKPSKAINIPLIPQIERVQQVRLLTCWVSYFRPIYPSHHILSIFWLYPPSDSICWTNWKKCPSHLSDLAAYLGHPLFHAFYMLYLLFTGSF